MPKLKTQTNQNNKKTNKQTNKRECIREELLQSLEGIETRAAKTVLYSTVTGKEASLEDLDGKYWWENVRKAVLFEPAIRAILEKESVDAFVEISPHPVLASSLIECCSKHSDKIQVVSTLKRKEDDQVNLLATLAQLYCSGQITGSLFWRNYFFERHNQQQQQIALKVKGEELEGREDGRTASRVHEPRFVSLPLYPFQRQKYWHETVESAIFRVGPPSPSWALLGTKVLTPTSGNDLVWQCEFSLGSFPWVRDHVIQGSVIFPGAGYFAMAISASVEHFGYDKASRGVCIENLEFKAALVVKEADVFLLQLHLVPLSQTQAMFYIRSKPKAYAAFGSNPGQSQSQFTIHSTGLVSIRDASPKQVKIDEVKSRMVSSKSKEQCYEVFDKMSMNYGKCFQGIQSVLMDRERSECFAVVERPCEESIRDQDFYIHPGKE